MFHPMVCIVYEFINFLNWDDCVDRFVFLRLPVWRSLKQELLLVVEMGLVHRTEVIGEGHALLLLDLGIFGIE